MEQIIFDSEDGEELSFFVIEETTIGGIRYLLVSDEDPETPSEEDKDATILKCVSSDDDQDVYEFVEDDDEWDAVLSVFEELIDDFDLDNE